MDKEEEDEFMRHFLRATQSKIDLECEDPIAFDSSSMKWLNAKEIQVEIKNERVDTR